MPGVPSGRGCEACRRQKKKCDLIRPSCSRCSRVSIACVGSGQRRFKFKVVEGQSTALVSHIVNQETRSVPVASSQEIIRLPSNEMTMLTSAFCSALEVKDVRYDMSIYGHFLRDLPKRLGSSAALDASVNALTVSLTSVYSRYRSPHVYESYIQGLKALRICLSDPKEVRTANTICAMYLMLICQGWIGHHDDCTSHAEAISCLVNGVSSQDWRDSFEADLLNTLCVVIIIESLFNPRVRLGPWLGQLTEARDISFPIESLKLGRLAKLSDYIHHREAHHSEIQSTYHQMVIDLPGLREKTSILSQNPALKTYHAQCQAAYGVLLTFVITLNIILRAFESQGKQLTEKCEIYVDEVIPLAEDASQYRPLGSSSMPLCLISAWAATNDATKRMKIEEILAEYQADFAISRWMDIASKMEAYLIKDRLPLSRSLSGSACT